MGVWWKVCGCIFSVFGVSGFGEDVKAGRVSDVCGYTHGQADTSAAGVMPV
jgi:hypothetical protein